ncbi:MAG: hypothetical protein RIR10_659 [Planctomycetota bacterium]
MGLSPELVADVGEQHAPDRIFEMDCVEVDARDIAARDIASDKAAAHTITLANALPQRRR